MRTLKKSLALVLALVMVLGLGDVGASADNKLDDYTDAKDIGDAYVEAVGVMTGLEIVDGMTETTIDPTATYTREQAAKIIAYMVLGKSAADSLTCTVAPFDDVAADRWSAGYISFCVEQGIIDGMTDTTFEPTGTLTGFQWAKMLLSAVGFNANGEFTGDSWSLNTARVAHSVGLFSGDAAGADHVALQRQQAMLYAFNTLTGIGQVTYSESLGDYFYNYSHNGIGDRVTPEDTLGVSVFDLYSAEGILVRVEGAGNSKTVVSSSYSQNDAIASVNAGNDMDMLFHAARVWYVGDAAVYNDAGTAVLSEGTGNAVYTYDLAKVTEYDCATLDDAADDVAKLNIPNYRQYTLGAYNNIAKVYEADIIDNSAIDAGYFYLQYQYQLGTMGTKHANGVDFNTNGTFDYSRVDYDNVWTNIDNIDRFDGIVFIRADYGDSETFHVYPLTSTTGTVVSKDNTTKAITLSDGTVLDASVFADAFTTADPAIGGTYTFTLDSHGHYINWTGDKLGTIVYYTGTCRSTSAHDAWSADYAWVAQCVDVETGEPVEVPVTTTWKNDHDDLRHAGYYDVTNTDSPTEYTGQTNPAYGTYMYKSSSVTFNANTRTISNVWEQDTATNKTVYINPNTVTFVIATGVGEGLDTKTYTGVSDLLTDYASADGINSIAMNNLLITVSGNTGSDNDYIGVTIFAFPEYTSGGILYFPNDVNTSAWVQVEGGFQYSGGYLNGTKVTPTIFVENVRNTTIEKGFYTFQIDTDGYWTLGAKNQATVADGAQVEAVGAPGALALEYNNNSYDLTDETIIVDLRTDVPSSEYIIDSVDDLVPGNFNEVYDAQLTVGFSWNSNGDVTVIYITDDGIAH